jgi:hypothetical protein
MIGSSLSSILVVGAAVALVSAGLWAIVSLVVQRRAGAFDALIEEPKSAVPQPASRVALSVQPADLADDAPHKVVVDEGLVEELFAEMFSIRATIGQLRSDLHALNAATHPAATEPPPATPQDDPHIRAAA